MKNFGSVEFLAKTVSLEKGCDEVTKRARVQTGILAQAPEFEREVEGHPRTLASCDDTISRPEHAGARGAEETERSWTSQHVNSSQKCRRAWGCWRLVSGRSGTPPKKTSLLWSFSNRKSRRCLAKTPSKNMHLQDRIISRWWLRAQVCEEFRKDHPQAPA